jgi:hypothetical protein
MRAQDAVGLGVISEISQGYAGYNNVMGRDNAAVGRMLLENGCRRVGLGLDSVQHVLMRPLALFV